MAATRRMGPKDSATAQSILDATERVLRSKGYSAITSQSVAEEAGVRRQLIFYYFQNIDEMLLAAFKRRMSIAIERLKQHSRSERPLHEIWEGLDNAFDASLVFEYTALANHHEVFRKEIADFVEEAREIETRIFRKVYREKNTDPEVLPPEAAAFLLSSITMSLIREKGTGINRGHAAIRVVVERFLRALEQ